MYPGPKPARKPYDGPFAGTARWPAMDDFNYADPSTLQGRLQRGRGLGTCCASATAADLVYGCVLTDSRWERQTEQRNPCLARLTHRLDLPLAPMQRHLLDNASGYEAEIELAPLVLALLPFVGGTDDAVPSCAGTRPRARERRSPDRIELDGGTIAEDRSVVPGTLAVLAGCE